MTVTGPNLSSRFAWFTAILCLTALCAQAADYLPPANGAWATRTPAKAGFDAAKLKEAIDFAIAQESPAPRDLGLAMALNFAREPYDGQIGPLSPRGAPTGLIIRHGYVVAQWGEPDRADMTFSVTKSFLSTLVGIALERGMIRDVNDPVRGYVPSGYFESDHNRPITWNQMLRQTSNWQGTLWGKPDWADRPIGDNALAWPTLPVAAPGAAWKYNDVRVNLLALAALYVWKQPLPEVLKREVMDPIGASATWHWEGYENSWVEVDGKRMQSVPGGGHWGGGMFISAWDQARFGLLTLHRGKWGTRAVYSQKWYDFASTPTDVQPTYGVMNWFLNTERKPVPAAPADVIMHLGNGTNMIYVDPDHDLVAVVRWIRDDQRPEFIARLLAALK
jgi:CubicO group peptidase (beta-lactamase class C family)